MKKRGSFTIVISLFLVMTMMILTPFGALCGYAEDGTEEVSVESQTPAVEVTEDGHIDGERLKQWVDAYLKADRWDEPQCAMSIGLWYSGTDETWFYNPDEWMYGVNWSKLPISMYFAEKLAKGELSKDTVITGITLEYALQTVLESSSGPSIYSMLTYLGGNSVSNCAELVPQYAGLPEDYYTDEFYQESYYTARIMHEVTKTLYRGGDERFPNVLEYMKKSQPWDMFNRDDYIRNNFSAAQAHAASWGDGAGDFIHCTGVLYTPTPIVLTIMMKNISDLDIMGGVAHHIAELAVAMDAKQQEIRLAAVPVAACPCSVSRRCPVNAAQENHGQRWLFPVFLSVPGHDAFLHERPVPGLPDLVKVARTGPVRSMQEDQQAGHADHRNDQRTEQRGARIPVHGFRFPRSFRRKRRAFPSSAPPERYSYRYP